MTNNEYLFAKFIVNFEDSIKNVQNEILELYNVNSYYDSNNFILILTHENNEIKKEAKKYLHKKIDKNLVNIII